MTAQDDITRQFIAWARRLIVVVGGEQMSLESGYQRLYGHSPSDNDILGIAADAASPLRQPFIGFAEGPE